MRTWMFLVVCLGGLAAANLDAHAQRFPTMGLIPDPTSQTTTRGAPNGRSWLPSVGGWATFGGYAPSDPYHAWHYEVGGILELVRSSRSSLLVLTQSTLIAASNNTIRFNPRAMFWEEGLLFTRRYSSFTLQLGYYHRCKHDIDNLEAEVQRALIYGSALGRAIVPVTWGSSTGHAAVRTDLYTLRQDDRRPYALDSLGSNWNRLLGSIGVHGYMRHSLTASGSVGLYATAFGRLTALSENTGFLDRMTALDRGRVGYGASLGVSVRGTAEIRVGLEYEYVPDTGVSARPRDAHLLRVVVRTLKPDLFR